jgi:hypothetical protein
LAWLDALPVSDEEAAGARTGERALLASQAGVAVVGSAGSGVRR